MYKIYLDGEVLHNSKSPDTAVVNPVLVTEMGSAGMLEFSVPVINKHYSDIKKLVSTVSVYQDDTWVWSGRVLDQTMDWHNSKVIKCEGMLNYLNDSVIHPHSNFDESKNRNMDLEEYLRFIIDEHNKQVEVFKAFELGRVTVDFEKYNEKTGDEEIPETEEPGYRKTMDIINDLVEKYGGYLVVKPKTENTTYPVILELLKEYDNSSHSQTVEFGKNLLDIERSISGTDIFSAVIPTGQTDSSGDPLTVIDAAKSGGSVVIEDEELIKLFGRIIKTTDHSDIDDEDELYAAGEKDLAEMKKKMYKVSVNALDLSLVDKNISTFRVGDSVRVLSNAHDFDMKLPVTSIRLDLAYPDKSELTLGDSVKRISDKMTDAAKKSAESYKKLRELKNSHTWIVYADDTKGLHISTVQLPSSKFMGVAWNKETAKVDISDPGIFAWSPIEYELRHVIECTKAADTATFYADVYRGGVKITDMYDDSFFKWYVKNEDGEKYIGRGKTIKVNVLSMGYGGTIVCEFAHIREFGLLDRQSDFYVDGSGKKYIVRS